MNLNFEDLENALQEEQTFDFDKTFNSCFVDLSIEIPKPEILISIGTHEYKGNHYDTAVCTAGEFSAIVGQSKSKKSFLKSAICASYIGGNTNNLFPNIKGHRTKDYGIIDIDTEQGNYYAQRTFRRPIEMVGGNYQNYHSFATRHLSTPERLKFTDELLINQSKFCKEKVKLLFIDGVADLVENTNDLVMSKEVADYLLRWTSQYNIHICTVIHKASGTNKPLGHLGTFVLKKAETVIDLEKDDLGQIKVTNPYSRGYQFEEFSFYVNKNALPYLVE